VTTSNPLYSPAELAHQLKDAGASRVLTVPQLLPVVAAASAAAGLSASSTLVMGEPSAAFLFADVSKASAALRALPDIASVNAAADVLALPYSSGTTGLAKGVSLSHSNLATNIEQVTGSSTSGDLFGLGTSDVMVGVLPFYHIYGITTIMGASLRVGATVVTLPKFDPPQFLSTIVVRLRRAHPGVRKCAPLRTPPPFPHAHRRSTAQRTSPSYRRSLPSWPSTRSRRRRTSRPCAWSFRARRRSTLTHRMRARSGCRTRRCGRATA
jgi:acyl-CoA synthetase (AMP-forming)/AMP-acid ligase II